MKNCYCFFCFLAAFCLKIQAQNGLSFTVGVQTAYDLNQLDPKYIADPNLTFPAGGEVTRFHVINPIGFQGYVNWNIRKGFALQSGFEMVKRKITYYTAFSSIKDCVVCDVDVDMPLYSVPLNLLIRLNPNSEQGNWAISFKAGLSGQWSGKSDNVFRSSGSASFETPDKVSIEEVSEGEYKMFLVVDEEFGIGSQFGLGFIKAESKFGSIGIEIGFRNQWFNTTSLQVWGYDKDLDSRVDGYNPYYFKFTNLYIALNYLLPWKIGKK